VRPLTIEMPGGTVTVSGTPDNLILDGEVKQTFSGTFSFDF
jgi:diaminopimelate epimerase